MSSAFNSPLQPDCGPAPATAVILAGGLGTRLRLAVAGRPKVLAPAAGRPFLDYLVQYLATQGIRRVILSVGHLAGQVQEFAGSGERWGVEVQYSIEESPLGTGGAMRRASQALDSPFFGLNGDTLFQTSLGAFWQCQRQSGAIAALALRKDPGAMDDLSQRGLVRLNDAGLILSFDEKPASLPGSPEALTNAGVYLFDPSALDFLPLGQPASLEREVFPQLAARSALAGCILPGYFADIGTPASLAAFEEDLLSDRVPGLSRSRTGETEQKAQGTPL